MEKQKPSIYAAKIDKKFNNNKKYSITREEENYKQVDTSNTKYEKDINQKIREIFGSSRYVYKANVKITLKDSVITKKIIGRNKNQIITIEGELINISDILDIEFA